MRSSIIIILLLAMHETMLLKARYTPVPGTGAEYGQGAVERCGVRHREVERFVWLIAVDPPADPAEWRAKLNANVDPRHGAFAVERPAAEEEEAVRSGTIPLQR